MATTLPQAVDALRTAVEDLTHSIATQGDDGSGRWLVGVTVVLVAVTACYAWQTHRLVRETRTATEQTVRLEQERRSEEKRMLAGVLVAELRVYQALLARLNPCSRDEAQKRSFNEAVYWYFDSARTGFFDRAGTRLFLLGPDVLQKTAECYSLIRRTLDGARLAQRLAESHELVPAVGDALAKIQPRIARAAKKAHASALSEAAEAISAIDALVPKLREVAQTEELLRS